MDAVTYILHGSTFDAARYEVNQAEKRGVDANVVEEWRTSLTQCEADGDWEAAGAIGGYASDYGTGGAYDNRTVPDYEDTKAAAVKKVDELETKGSDLIDKAESAAGAGLDKVESAGKWGLAFVAGLLILYVVLKAS